jgi:hypothetical protein
METIQEKQKRGILTQRIKDKSIELLGYEISQKELRLMVHINYLITNNQKLEFIKLDLQEQHILDRWHITNLLTGTIEKLVISKYFWDAISEILWLGYVDIDY